MQLLKTSQYERSEKKFFKHHRNLISKYGEVLKKLRNDPFDKKLKTHKLSGDLSHYYACSITYEYRIILIIASCLVALNPGTVTGATVSFRRN